jgi:hypothetical protein
VLVLDLHFARRDDVWPIAVVTGLVLDPTDRFLGKEASLDLDDKYLHRIDI